MWKFQLQTRVEWLRQKTIGKDGGGRNDTFFPNLISHPLSLHSRGVNFLSSSHLTPKKKIFNLKIKPKFFCLLYRFDVKFFSLLFRRVALYRSSAPMCIMEILKYFIKPNQIIRIQLFVEAPYRLTIRRRARAEWSGKNDNIEMGRSVRMT